MNDHRVALITGGARGIGRAIAEALVAEGIDVHICDIDEGGLGACLVANPGMKGSHADMSNSEDVARVFTDLAAYTSRLDILVNNVGIAGPTALVENIELAQWEQTIAIDLNATFYATRQATPLIKKAKGSIINIASNAALFGFPLRSPYVASKWALIGLTKTWAMEMGPDGVNVNAICPGSVKGPRIDGVIDRDAGERGLSAQSIRDVYLRQSSMRVFIDATEIAETVKFLCSPAGHNISGQSIAIDGHTEGLSNWLE